MKIGKVSHPAQLPLALSNKPVGYILELAGKPVAVLDAANKAAGGKGLSTAKKNSLIAQLKAKQDVVAAGVKQLGGIVTSRFQYVYNGIAVHVPAVAAFKLAHLPGVVAMFRMKTFTPDNVVSVPLIGAPAAWGGTPGFSGTGMKIADIDTGIDYTHADFGGSGLTSDWACASANSTADPSTVTCSGEGQSGNNLGSFYGPNAPKVKGGWDFVGNDYNANGTGDQLIPQPDPNPLDCNGHGSHTAGTAAGFGVLSNGSTYTGPYNATTVSGNTWKVGPGVAPNASIYALRVFGCNGSVDDGVLISAIDWAGQHGMDAVNMSLGAPFGSPNDPDSAAVSNATNDGTIVVSASGNNGSSPYITSSPGAGTTGISVAASDPTQSFAGASMSTYDGTVYMSQSNDVNFSDGLSAPLFIVQDDTANNGPSDTGPIGEGCSASDYTGSAGDIVVTMRNNCARVLRDQLASAAGAVAVIMVNNAPGYPPLEGHISGGTIPFLGALESDTQAFLDSAGDTETLNNDSAVTNPLFLNLASFSSWGPTTGGLLKPEVTAPGVSIPSVGMGTGTGAVTESGTSMATPHTSGLALLVKQAHPTWKKVQYWKDAIVNTANASMVGNDGGDPCDCGYYARGAGAGFIQAYDATHTQVVASGFPNGMSSLNFGIDPIKHDFTAKGFMRLHNFGSSPATFNLGTTEDNAYQSVSFFALVNHQSVPVSQVTVPAGGNANVQVQLSESLAASEEGQGSDPFDSLIDSFIFGYFPDVAGLVTLTPATESDNNGIPLTVAYYAVPTAASSLKVKVDTSQLNTANKNCAPHASCGIDLPVKLSNGAGVWTYSDWFAVGGTSPVSQTDIGSADLLAAGVSTINYGDSVFGIKVNKPWTNIAEDEFDFLIDVNGDGIPDYDVFTYDHGLLTTGTSDGIPVTYVYAINSGDLYSTGLTLGTFNGTTMEMYVPWDDLCIDGNPCLGDSQDGSISYVVESFDRNGGQDMIGSLNNDGSFASTADPINLFCPPFLMDTDYQEYVLDANSTINTTAHINTWAWGQWPQEGIMSFNLNNRSRFNADESSYTPITLPG